MKKVIIVWSLVNQIGFGVRVNTSDADMAEEIFKTEFEKWSDPEENPDYYNLGYAEPAETELEKHGIEYELLDEEQITNPENADEFNPALNAKIIFI